MRWEEHRVNIQIILELRKLHGESSESPLKFEKPRGNNCTLGFLAWLFVFSVSGVIQYALLAKVCTFCSVLPNNSISSGCNCGKHCVKRKGNPSVVTLA